MKTTKSAKTPPLETARVSENGRYMFISGHMFDREEALKLREMIDEFLIQCPVKVFVPVENTTDARKRPVCPHCGTHGSAIYGVGDRDDSKLFALRYADCSKDYHVKMHIETYYCACKSDDSK